MLLQHCFRQKLLGDHRKKDGIKWHMILHMPLYIHYFGPSHLWDMVRYEKAHGGVKDSFAKTSQRFGTANMEILRKRRVAFVISSEAKRLHLEDTILQPLGFVRQGVRNKKLEYETETGIIFESYEGTLQRHELFFNRKLNIGKWTWKGDYCPFISPLVTQDMLHNIIATYIAAESSQHSAKKYNGINTYICYINTYLGVK